MLRVRGLACARGGQALLEAISFDLDAGQALILRGPNGVGKTTLLRVLAGVQPPQAGTIAMPPDCSAYASHADGVKASLTVAENLRFWAQLYRRTLTDSLYAEFNLAALRHRLAGTLSAGQRRRVGLARLGVIGRTLWFLDEPTVSLDAASVSLFTRAMAGHLATGGALVIATHLDIDLPAAVLDLRAFRPLTPAAGEIW